MAVVTELELKTLYVEEGKTDKEIATIKGVDRTYISQLRKKWGIATRPSISTKALSFVTDKLESMGFKVENVKDKDKTSNYDLLLNGEIKVEVKSSASFKDGKVKFPLTNSPTKQLVDSNNQLRLPNGRYRKLFRNTCNYIVFVGYHNLDVSCWIMRSTTLTDINQGVTFPIDDNVKSKYKLCREDWNIIS